MFKPSTWGLLGLHIDELSAGQFGGGDAQGGGGGASLPGQMVL